MSRSADGLIWTDRIPLLEEVADFQGRPGGIAGLDYVYCPIGSVMDMTSAPAPTEHPHTGKPINPARVGDWQWHHASNQVFRFISSATSKHVDVQILCRGEAVPGSCPGWYRVRTYVHPDVFKGLGWSTEQATAALGHNPTAQPAAKAVVQMPKAQQAAAR